MKKNTKLKYNYLKTAEIKISLKIDRNVLKLRQIARLNQWI